MPVIESGLLALILTGVLGYLLGSIPFGIVITRAFGLGDLRQIGSGNIGATNVLRTGNKPAALATLLLDSGKGAIAVLIARFAVGEDAAQLAALTSFLGHLFPVWLGFRGGKGVATFLGTLLALAWPVGIACCLTWLATAAVSRISSLSALVAAASSVLWMFLLGQGQMALLGLLLTAMIFYRHSANISRLMAGTEPRIGAGKKAS
ncbi:glycerol-3-phosphate 1-O-acyltransferase PlsY [Cereibacter sphaeroides]|uniref:glycerol-3-phosphate 1-O-acyltransferase PlsY n=1 Tax=Cereibacter sphaeroides TaxID=1063 RepID=UPI001F431BB2|nr:glycerol-3-phosphate 1-O-acyltransferase PlsY [Cereibacter sphaeroides]MCE6958876.1 glycerol-3-phosphate 1-O-acyltransferase PlsY [Cereibacter sphaeroides]MCE6973514.1 glycerol-3-phosphate 1-O-acyltransferase PlsY [Cereibacter sphaeroides]